MGCQQWDAPQTVEQKYSLPTIGAGLDRLVLLTRGVLADGAQRNRRPLSPWGLVCYHRCRRDYFFARLRTLSHNRWAKSTVPTR